MIRPILQSQNKLRIPITNKTNFKPVLSLNFPGVLAGHDNRVSCLGVTEVTAFLMIPCHLLFAFVCGIFGSWILGRKNSRHRSMGLLHSSLCPSYRHWMGKTEIFTSISLCLSSQVWSELIQCEHWYKCCAHIECGTEYPDFCYLKIFLIYLFSGWHGSGYWFLGFFLEDLELKWRKKEDRGTLS